MFTICLTIIIAGLLGAGSSLRTTWLVTILRSLAASAAVPVFLSITNSPILREAVSGDLTATVTFFSFCVLAAVFAQYFLVKVAGMTFGHDEKVDVHPNDTQPTTTTTTPTTQVDNPPEDREALSVLGAMMGSRTFYTVERLSLLTTTPLEKLSAHIETLETYGLIHNSAYNGNFAWSLTAQGQVAISRTNTTLS